MMQEFLIATIVFNSGKVFPRLKRQTNNTANSNLDEEEVDEPSDYVFRIIFNAINPSQDQNNYGMHFRIARWFFYPFYFTICVELKLSEMLEVQAP